MKEIRLIHGAHSPSQADIRLVNWNGKECVLRDYSSPRSWPFRRLCRWALRREIKAHRLMEGLDGVPALLEVLDPDRYLIEFVEGKALSDLSSDTPPEDLFFENLSRILREMHSRGVAHGDLRNKNILIRSDGKPFIIDFSTAWWGISLWRKPLFSFYKTLDNRRLAKTKAKFAPGTLSEEEKRLLKKDPWYLKVGRLYRHGLYRLIRSRSRQEP